MASSDPEPSDFLTCLHCGALCLGPTVLPCGHLLCRKCVRQMAEEQASSPACPFCGQLVPRGQHSIREFLDVLGVDFVLEELVNHHLAQQDSIPCVACPDKIASKACLDCGEMCCQSCSNSHSKMRATKEHIQHDLLCVEMDEPEGDVCGEDTDSGTPQYNQSQLLFENLHQLKEKAAILNSAQAIVTDLVMKVQKLNKRLSGDLRMLDFYNTRLSRPDIGVKCDVDALRPRLQRMLSECFVPDPAALDQMSNLMAGKTESGDGACDAYHCVKKQLGVEEIDFHPHGESQCPIQLLLQPDQRGISPKQTESKSTQSDPLPSASPSDVQPTESSDDANQESGQKLTLQFRLWEMEDERALLQEKLEEAETNNQQLTEQHDQLCQQVT
ncbi:hypothetical protein BaRGS_00027902 [Batillaria attramentaria]|uniref:RING-type E3 ubiquitin transferase n=1 Tax=Batillaria attramentaria TaxID=370345 RepID=A0ABD0K1Z0_9CAEN